MHGPPPCLQKLSDEEEKERKKLEKLKKESLEPEEPQCEEVVTVTESAVGNTWPTILRRRRPNPTPIAFGAEHVTEEVVTEDATGRALEAGQKEKQEILEKEALEAAAEIQDATGRVPEAGQKEKQD